MKLWRTLAALLLILLASCLQGPLPEELPSPTPAPTTTSPPITSLRFLNITALSYPKPPKEFAVLTPEITGLVHIPYYSTADVVSNDLAVLNHPRRLQILASIVSKYTILYTEPANETGMLLYYSVYKLNDSETAQEILEAYRKNWNKRALDVPGGRIWVWDGFIDEMAGRMRPFEKDTILYWNPEAATSFFADRVLPNHPALTTPVSTLYSVHGETAYGPYFIMMDIKTLPKDIRNRTETIFKEAAEQIFTGNVSEAAAKAEVEQVIELRAELHSLLESYLAGNISKEEYESRFAEYEARLANLTNQSLS